jgi:hypothetical protein
MYMCESQSRGELELRLAVVTRGKVWVADKKKMQLKERANPSRKGARLRSAVSQISQEGCKSVVRSQMIHHQLCATGINNMASSRGNSSSNSVY